MTLEEVKAIIEKNAPKKKAAKKKPAAKKKTATKKKTQQKRSNIMNFNFLSPVSDTVLAHNELLSMQALGRKLKIHSEQKVFQI